MPQALPPFIPVTQEELRTLWVKYPNPEVRRLALEVARYRKVLAEIDQLYKITHQAWRDTHGGNLIALHQLQALMYAERERLP